MNNGRLTALIVAVALFMENMDSTVIATSLPTIAADIGTNPLALKLAITSYLLSLAVFIPASGWTADRFGARTVFRVAIGVFVTGSICCALSSSLTQFVFARILQGMGGAMMTPVGRLVLLRTVDRRSLVDAMTWVTMPALIGPILGPPIGGFLSTFATWHWIFLINVPIGIIGVGLVTRYIEDIKADDPGQFDFVGMMLSGIGLGGMAFGLSVSGLDYLPVSVIAAIVIGGMISFSGYLLHARHTAQPVLDFSLFRIPTFRASVTGGFMFRLGVGAWPFLVPLLLQVGLGYNPFQSGLMTLAGAGGAMFMKPVIGRFLHAFGFRNVLVWNAIIAGSLLAVCAAFNAQTPFYVMFAVLLIGGFFRSLEFTSINTIAYADIPPEKASKATSLVSVLQQVSISCGVAVGALMVEMTLHARGSTATLQVEDFRPAFIAIGAISALACLVFMRLAPDAGNALTDRGPAAPDANDQKGG
jgi:EmrB/QacA subfamily drug resistance transporter